MATALYSITIKGRAQKDYNECVLHCEANGDLSPSRLDVADNLVTRFIAAVLPLWQNIFPDGYQVEGLIAKRVLPGGGPQSVRIFQDGAVPGQLSSQFCGNNVCPVLKLIPTLGTQTAGRIFLPCVATESLEGNAYDAQYLSDIDDMMDVLLNDFGTGTIAWQLAIYSRKNASYSLAVAYNVSPAIGFQRRRARPLG